jgi:S1-C subfamily serine protease
MKLISKPLFGVFAVVAGTATILCVSHFTSWAKDTPPAFTVSSTPINRDAGLGNSYAPIVKKVAPSVVNIYSTRFVK